eukprot:CAMPEP_0172547918 /NCGR_PEP_ID=MMETSP1067-20121228/17347_1 /TAXON_ID=265564 ORGANISM="Thalassiosira punctigera, Strain Tpunct2005C2" /NCGR_SAMPLE_ID=MMETSP1067 /ASSEMBLY_ACC=CAM_ASM_000444 /LENGTH=269 /DNA_ID=CAMNT_0013335077 /DNA_START=41 /DNA_END=850 /DNA_ORIENTATION=+
MVSVHQPLHRHRPTLSATDEFWLAPILAADALSGTNNDGAENDGAGATTATGGDEDGDQDDDSLVEMVIPPAHHQLLSADRPSYESLKGYDHNGNGGYGSDKSSLCQKLSAVKQQGGGSWLLGFALLNNAEHNEMEMEEEEGMERDLTPPGLDRIPSGASLDSDEYSPSEGESDNDSIGSAIRTEKRPRGGVSFSQTVAVQPIPHSCTLTPLQRRRMYSTSVEVRQNKTKSKKEYRYDGYDWRHATEEWEMSVDMVTGELIHPAHEQLV